MSVELKRKIPVDNEEDEFNENDDKKDGKEKTEKQLNKDNTQKGSSKQ